MSTANPVALKALDSRGRTFLGHPRGLFLLFMVEMWERFSYYGMRGLLVLYLASVFSAKELSPGVYRNTLRFTETKTVDGTEVKSSQARQVVVAVGPDKPAGPVAAPKSTGEPVLKITQVGPQVLANNAADPIVISGPKGGPFDIDKITYEVTNPTDKPVKCSINIDRETPGQRTFFTINDNSGTVTAEIKPDKERKSGDKPYQIVAALRKGQSGRNWIKADANTLYGWYTGLAYLMPILGGIIADRLIGTHRSMLIGGTLIALGHIILGLSGIGNLAQNDVGMSMFILGLAVIVLGTGHFKPTVSVMVGQLYQHGDPRRDSAFTIFYMGINLGAFLCAFVCGTLGQKVGWHWGFGSAAVGMLLGLLAYVIGRPIYLRGIGEAPAPGASGKSALFLMGALVVAVLFAMAYHYGAIHELAALIDYLKKKPALGWSVVGVLLAGIFTWMTWFISINEREDRGPVITIFVYIVFNAFFWLAFEQAGSSINVFTEENTNRGIWLPNWLKTFCASGNWLIPAICIVVGAVATIWFIAAIIRFDRRGAYGLATASILGVLGAIALTAVGILTPLGYMKWVANFNEIPATWFQSINAGLIFIFAPIFAGIWTSLGRRNLNPSQPIKIGLGLIFLGLGYVFMVWAGQRTIGNVAKASMMLIFMTYFWHTIGELCLSPTGLSYITKAAPVKFVSLLMGIWFISSFVANLGGGLVAAQVEAIEQRKIKLPWNLGGQADFFMLFVASSIGAGVLALIFSPLLKRLQHGRE